MPDDVAKFFDVDLTRTPDWIKRVKQYRVVRVPGFRPLFSEWASVSGLDDPAAEFTRVAKRVADELAVEAKNEKWFSASFHNNQTDLLRIDRPVLLDKALFGVHALNRLVVNSRATGRLQAELLGDHCMVCCAFSFPKLGAFLNLAAQDLVQRHDRMERLTRQVVYAGRDSPNDGARRYQSVLDSVRTLSNEAEARSWIVKYAETKVEQGRSLIHILAGDRPPEGVEARARGGTIGTASYPTLRALYKVVRRFPSVDASIDFGPTTRSDLLPLRRIRGANIRAQDHEYVQAIRVERSDYGWPTAKPDVMRLPLPWNFPDHPYPPPRDEPEDVLEFEPGKIYLDRSGRGDH